MTDGFIATMSVPGGLTLRISVGFDNPRDAWERLFLVRQVEEDANRVDPAGVEYCEYSETWNVLQHIASGEHRHGDPNEDWPTNADGTGEVTGNTPGRYFVHDEDAREAGYYDPTSPAYDRGLIYRVEKILEEES